MKKYNILTNKGIETVEGKRVPNKFGLELFAHKEFGVYIISEKYTGTKILQTDSTNLKDMKKELNDFLSNYSKEYLERQLENMVNKYGCINN